VNVIDLEKTTWKMTVGRLENRVISALNLSIAETDIVMWYDRVAYCRKHRASYASDAEYEFCINKIPDILANPDYVAKRPNSESIDYIKRIDKLMIVAVRVKDNGPFMVRSAYPLNEEQLSDYLTHGSAKKV